MLFNSYILTSQNCELEDKNKFNHYVNFHDCCWVKAVVKRHHSHVWDEIEDESRLDFKRYRRALKKPTDVPELRKLFESLTTCNTYWKKEETLVRLPTYAEVVKKQKLVTYVKKTCDGQSPGPSTYEREMESFITSSIVIARNPTVIGKTVDGALVYNEWAIPKDQFFKKYNAKASDLSENYIPFRKKAPITAIDITANVINLLQGSDGRAHIAVDFGNGCMEVEEGGLLTEYYAISKFDKKYYDKVNKKPVFVCPVMKDREFMGLSMSRPMCKVKAG